MTTPGEVAVLIAAAGRGTRAGLPYPKTLFAAGGTPILVRLLCTLRDYDREPTVIVSPSGREAVVECLEHHRLSAHLVVQPEPKGMGDAVLHFRHSPAHGRAENVMLAWGDLAFLQLSTVHSTVEHHFRTGSDFTFPTRMVLAPYTLVSRNADGAVLNLTETRGESVVGPGERDIGFFIFRRDVVMGALQEGHPDKYLSRTGEHGFLYVVKSLVEKGNLVEAIPVASDLDLISLNRLSDLEHIEISDKSSTLPDPHGS